MNNAQASRIARIQYLVLLGKLGVGRSISRDGDAWISKSVAHVPKAQGVHAKGSEIKENEK